MNKNFFFDEDKRPKVGLLNEDIVKNEFANANKKTNATKYDHIELSDYKERDNRNDYVSMEDAIKNKPTFNARNNNEILFEERKDETINKKNSNDKIYAPFSAPKKPSMQVPIHPPMQFMMNNYTQPLQYVYPIQPMMMNVYNPYYQQPVYQIAVTCPKCSLYQRIAYNVPSFICPRCNHIHSVLNINNPQNKILVCDKCKSNVIYQIGTSALIECSNCKTVNYAPCNDPKNLYGPQNK